MLHDAGESSQKMVRVDVELGNYTIQFLNGLMRFRRRASFMRWFVIYNVNLIINFRYCLLGTSALSVLPPIALERVDKNGRAKIR